VDQHLTGALGFSAKHFDWLWAHLASYSRSHRGKVASAWSQLPTFI